MGQGNVTIRAVLCDIYKTLLEVEPPPANAEARWVELCGAMSPRASIPSLAAFGAAADAVILRQHAEARRTGIGFPEIFWPGVAREAWPALESLDAAALGDFLFAQAQLQRTVRLMAGAADVLRACRASGLLLGLVSNCQPYTLRELDAALAGADLDRSLFTPDLCFFSFEQGFSKPDPYVFRILTARLAARGVAPGETLAVGDREDNDIIPARRAGFRTWWLTGERPGDDAGDWRALGGLLGRS